MATGRTVSATELTESDKRALEVCMSVSEALNTLTANAKNEAVSKPDEPKPSVTISGDPKLLEEFKRFVNKNEDFMKIYGRVHLSRDAGLGRAGAKLQRDALCTRGRTDKAPYSNRNLRWHPLIIATETPDYAQEVEDVTIDNKSLVFIINGELWYPKDVHKLPKVYCAPFDKWYAIKNELIQWDDKDWTENSCVIPAMEYSTLNYSVETFAILGIAVVANFYGVDSLGAYNLISEVFNKHNYKPSSEYPKENEIQEVMLCPLCLAPVNSPPARLTLPHREGVFQPPWRSSKREEGEAESLQLFHTIPLKESKIYHTPRLVRYGHRWCNVAVTDHSVDETVDFMRAVVEAHEIKGKNK